MQPINYTQFQTHFASHFKNAVEDKAHVTVKKVKSGIFTFRPMVENESLTGVRKITNISIAQMKKELPRVFDALAGNINSRRAFIINEQTAILKYLGPLD